MNIATIMGRIGQNPQIREVRGTKFASFSVATSKRYTKGNGEKVETTTWHRIKGIGKICETIERSVVKGAEVFIVGEIENGSYEKDGQKINTSEIVIGNMGSLIRVLSDGGKKPQSQGEPLPGDKLPPTRTDHSEKDDKLDDSVPF